ncbi:MAG: glycosyltransferase family 4 protein [Acidimicrobiia bacterium]
MDRGRVVMGLLFSPRGGSAYVVRYLSPALARAGWSVSLAVGSHGAVGEETHAPTFFDGLDVHPLDYTAAIRAFEAGGDAIAAPRPMHPSYEDRAGVPDVVFASVAPELAEHLSAAWEAPLRAADADRADVFHLHHLTPQLDAVKRHWPDTPLVVHLHGTELKMLAAIAERRAIAATLGETLTTMPESVAEDSGSVSGLDADRLAVLRTTRWDSWRHGEFWAAKLIRDAQLADHVITVSPANRDNAISVLGLEPERVTAIPNGVDLERFRPRPRTPGSRRALFRRVLVEDPQGWTESGPAGTLAYTEADLDRLLGTDDDATVLLFVGRFLGFKRVPALVRSFARARHRFTAPASLVVWGGHPGEWEGEHPASVAEEVGAQGIYFAGWRGHDDLPEGLAASDVLVVPSVDDPYPQVPLEAMAVGLPVAACHSGGLRSMVNVDPANPTGWFVPPDDADALAEVLVRVVNDPTETAERGANALAHARAELSWDRLAARFEAVYARAIEHRERRESSPGS